MAQERTQTKETRPGEMTPPMYVIFHRTGLTEFGEIETSNSWTEIEGTFSTRSDALNALDSYIEVANHHLPYTACTFRNGRTYETTHHQLSRKDFRIFLDKT